MATTNWRTVDREQFTRDWNENLTIQEICEKHSLTKDQVIRLRDVFACPKRMNRKLRRKPLKSADPTPEYIEKCCIILRNSWTRREERWRRKYVPEWNVMEAGKVPGGPPLECGVFSVSCGVSPSSEIPPAVAAAIGAKVNYKLIKLAQTDESNGGIGMLADTCEALEYQER